MGEQLAAKIYWDRETGFCCLVTEQGIDGLDKINLAIDVGRELMKLKCHANNEQPLLQMFPVLHYDAQETRELERALKHLDGLRCTRRCDERCNEQCGDGCAEEEGV